MATGQTREEARAFGAGPVLQGDPEKLRKKRRHVYLLREKVIAIHAFWGATDAQKGKGKVAAAKLGIPPGTSKRWVQTSKEIEASLLVPSEPWLQREKRGSAEMPGNQL